MKNKALNFVKSISEEEMKFISMADYGEDSEQHLEALRELIFEQDCIVSQEQSWFPYEVVELTRWECKTGHEKEFAICNIIIALSVIAGTDNVNEPADMFDRLSQEYDKLPDQLRDLVSNLLIEADSQLKLYEIATN